MFHPKFSTTAKYILVFTFSEMKSCCNNSQYCESVVSVLNNSQNKEMKFYSLLQVELEKKESIIIRLCKTDYCMKLKKKKLSKNLK